MAERPLKDQDARDVIRKGLDRNVMVLAGAGAGKTHELILRMVNCVRAGQDVGRMAAITFTRKAAGEMRGRLFGALREQGRKSQGKEAEAIRRGLARIDQCFIGTIHSFCGRLLRERPVEARLTPDFTEIEDREETVLCREHWDRHIQQCFLDGDTRLDGLRELGLTTEGLFTFYRQRRVFNDLPLKETTTEKPDLEPAVRQLTDFLETVRGRVPELLPKGRDGFLEVVARADDLLRYRDMSSDSNRIAFLRLLEKKPEVKVTYWGEARAYAKELRDELLPDFQTRILEPILVPWRQYVYRHAAAFVDAAVQFSDQERHTAGKLTFQDLLRKAADLLRDHPEVRVYFQNRYHRLFVDEFQDTDPIQAEVLFYLTGEDTQERDWPGLVPRPGSLFLVGDEKQSIYRFRRADVETFRLVSDRIAETGGQVVHLDTSFRSFGRLCGWFNDAFEPLFADQEPRYQAAFSRLFQHRSDGADASCVRRIPIEKVHHNIRAQIAALDAGRIADFISGAVAGQTEFNGAGEDAVLGPKANPGDFLILTRTTRCLGIYAQALEARGLPYDIVGGKRLGDSSEVKPLTDLLEAVYRPDDPLPLLGYLRGPFVGLGDDELYGYRQSGGHFNWRDDLPEDLPEGLRRSVSEAYGRLAQVSRWMHEQSPSMAMEWLLEDLGFMAFSAAETGGATRAGNLVRLLALVREWQNQGMHWGQIVCEIRDLIDDPDYDVEEMTLEAGQRNVVRLMNLHQAKGLEAPVVFLADPYDTSTDGKDVSFHVSRIGKAPSLAMPVRRARGEYKSEVIGAPEGWADDAEEEARFLEAENVRLLYVAATRARNLLVVSCYEGNRDKGPWASLYPYLADVPELPNYPTSTSPEPETLPLDWDRQREDRAEKWEAVKRPGYVTESVTDADSGSELQPQLVGGHGKGYGSLVHRLFDAAVTGRLPVEEAEYLQHLLEASEVDPSLFADAQRALEAFRESAIWEEIQNTQQVHTEVPFAAHQKAGERTGVLRGTIDLVYRVPGGWKIVDYKTDGMPGDDGIEAVVARYAPQVNAYATRWEDTTGEPVVEKGLWLAEVNIWQEI